MNSQSLQHNDFTHTDIDTQNKLMKTTNQQKSYDDVTPEEIQAMGGKVTHTNHSNKGQSSSTLSNSNLMTTDDEIGNGESIFDFNNKENVNYDEIIYYFRCLKYYDGSRYWCIWGTD